MFYIASECHRVCFCLMQMVSDGFRLIPIIFVCFYLSLNLCQIVKKVVLV